jgi:hypothetical protein
MSFDIYSGLLKTFSAFEKGETGLVFHEANAEFDKQALVQKYNLQQFTGTDFEKTNAMMKWLCEHIHHDGQKNYSGLEPNPLTILDFAYDKSTLNCRYLSIAFTGCLNAIGIQAYTVYINPCSPYDSDNHVVTVVDGIMFDPTWCVYCKDKDGKPLSLFEVRETLANQEKLYVSDSFSYNGEKCDIDFYAEYMAKDLFYMGFKNGDYFYTICPKGFDVKKRVIANIEWRIKQFGDNENMQTWLNSEKEYKYLFVAPEDFPV